MVRFREIYFLAEVNIMEDRQQPEAKAESCWAAWISEKRNSRVTTFFEQLKSKKQSTTGRKTCEDKLYVDRIGLSGWKVFKTGVADRKICIRKQQCRGYRRKRPESELILIKPAGRSQARQLVSEIPKRVLATGFCCSFWKQHDGNGLMKKNPKDSFPVNEAGRYFRWKTWTTPHCLL
jgi:hypothetical protein